MKARVRLLLQKHPALSQFVSYFFNFFCNHKRLQFSESFGGKNPNETFLVIRPNTEDCIQGLMSLFIQTMRWIEYAERKGYIPYVDFLNYKTQYYVHGKNAWEFFFQQPSNFSFQEITQSKKVIFSGITPFQEVDLSLFKDSIFRDKDLLKKSKYLVKKYGVLNDDIKKKIEYEKKSIDVDSCIGLYVRGTDYTSLKPVGEHIQPSIQEIFKAVDSMLVRHTDAKIFLVTEDEEKYKLISNRYGSIVQTIKDDSFIKNYSGKDFLSKENCLDGDKEKRGKDYLVKIMLLSQCRYFVSSITMGSIAAYCFKESRYDDEYIFDLGLYK